jgi:hypothetical protein
MALEFSQQDLEEFSNTKFEENPSSGTRVVPLGRTDRQAHVQTRRHYDANSRLSQFWEGA